MSKHRLSLKSEHILTLISQGHTYEQILGMNSNYTYMDIFAAAKEALELSNRKVSKDAGIQKIREQYPRAYEPWTQEEENQLITLYHEGRSTNEISEIMERQPGAIRSRIEKLSLEEKA